MLGAGVERTDRDHTRRVRRQLARYERLQGDDNLRTDKNRVLAGMRGGAVGADAMHDDVDRIGARVRRAFRSVDLARRRAGPYVKRQRVIGRAEAFPDAVIAQADAGPPLELANRLRKNRVRDLLTHKKVRPVQRIRYARSTDGTDIAWAETGTGTPIVKASNWLTHLNHDLENLKKY